MRGAVAFQARRIEIRTLLTIRWGSAKALAGEFLITLLVLRRHLGELVAALPVVALPGLVLASSAPAGPGPDSLGVGCVPLDQAGQQVADFRQRVADHARVAGTDPFFTAVARLAASQARASMDKVMWAYQARQVRTW